MGNLTSIIKDSFLQFGGAVLQSRALPDARDLMKPSARQIFYCLYTDKFIHDKPFQKTLKAIGSCFRMYIHGDSSAEGVIMRAGQPFAMRYPLIEVKGGYGTLLAAESWSAPRYSSARLSELSNYIFKDIEKDTIAEWRDNYDNTEQYPMVLPSKGFYNLVNGSYGIGVGASSSIPSYNLKELNEALIKVLWNPNIDFEEIYCAPDFPTGASILNGNEIKESHKHGTGAACKLRATINYDSTEKILVVTEIPYMVYTETICKQLEDIINGENNPGIERFNDLTGEQPLIKIYLKKGSNPTNVLKSLYKNTSLQTHYSINFTVLEDGRFPKVYTWKQLLQAHINHEKEVYTRGYKFDLKKINTRLHIIEGLLKAIDVIDEVINGIKVSSDSKAAARFLQDYLDIDEEQAKAILDIKLARLAHLEVDKLIKEQNKLNIEKEKLEIFLNDENELKKEIEKGFREVANKFGDERRTKILNLEVENQEPVDIKELSVNLTNKNNIYINETSTLYAQRKNSVGSKFKLETNEKIISSINIKTNDTILFFSDNGMYYHYNAINLSGEKIPVESLISSGGSQITAITSYNNEKENVIFVTKKGNIKKSSIKEYNVSKNIGIKAIDLEPEDSIISILFADDKADVGVLTKLGNFLRFNLSEVRLSGRVTKGVKAIKLNLDDQVVAADLINSSTNSLISISADGQIKKTLVSEIQKGTRYTKGLKLQRLMDNDFMVDFASIDSDTKFITIVSTSSQLKIKEEDISTTSKNTLGVKSIKLNNSKVQKIIKN